MTDKKWMEITVITTTEAVDAVSEIICEQGANGVSIEDPKDIINNNSKAGEWDYIDERLFTKNLEDVKIKGYLPDDKSVHQKIENIKNAVERLEDYGIKKGKGEISIKKVDETDWANSWKKYYKPLKIGDHIVIKPSWEKYTAKKDDIIIDLDPGMAFGTGTHETTRMCIGLLEKYIKNNSTVFDVGCGSGILSIASSKLGAVNVTGIDIDGVAVRVARENIRLNGAENIRILHGNLLDAVHGKADIIVANIIADAIIKISEIVPKFLKEGGVFISSGIISDRLSDTRDVLLNNGFKIIEIKEMGEWVAIASTVERKENA
ncbi:MAG: 50S ribosomal protein L11 methyltransferase [Clostridiales bacterium]|nr:50S ribosomal protein L11 methyltransferase [Clostridiales bacterium]